MLNLIFVLACANGPQASSDLAGAQGAQDVPAATPVVALPSKPAQTAPIDLPIEPVGEMPAGADKVQALLMARHNEDLPDKAAIDFHGDGQAILEYLAQADGSMVVQERALILLALYPGNALCSEMAAEAPHPKLRAAAVRCFKGKTLSAEELAVVQAAAKSQDPRVQAAVTAVLGE